MSLSLLLMMSIAQGVQAQSIFEQWPALKTFHGVMSETFHPSEEGDLGPIKARSAEMVEKASLLVSSPVPDAFNTPAILKAAKKLRKGSKALNNMVKAQAPDADITTALAGLHDVFHEIVGLCRDEHHN
ncbi:MAG: hypothetical protein SF053_10315 [Bacteroidia bacterium]|nr:hypothetical protein [Bacteroidia bacterium]